MLSLEITVFPERESHSRDQNPYLAVCTATVYRLQAHPPLWTAALSFVITNGSLDAGRSSRADHDAW
jgi:hypothetical protein